MRPVNFAALLDLMEQSRPFTAQVLCFILIVLGRDASGSLATGLLNQIANVVARVVDDIDSNSLIGFIRQSVSTRVSLHCADAWRSYKPLNKEFPHGIVDPRKGEYVVGAIHTNAIEGFWSLVKRGIMGTFHKVSHKYLPLYVNEYEFRYNNRMNPDIFGAAIRAC
jgi:hypothetical protein